MTFKQCPHCKGTRFSNIRDATISAKYNECGQACSPEISDWGTSQYVPICDKCGKHVERNEMVAL